MERLTEQCWRNLDPWECCGQDNFCQRGCHDLGGCTNGCIVPKLYARLAAYEDTELDPEEYKKHADAIKKLDIEHMHDLLQAEKDGRLVVLPCKDDTVYTIEEDYFNCGECKHGDSAYYNDKIDRISCDMNNDSHCPLYVKEHKVDGFEVKFDESGGVVLSSPGEFGYEGLEQFCGIDGKVYYNHEEAEAALKKMENAES